MRWRRKQPAVLAPPEQLWQEVVSLVSALDERDRARDVAVALEQENARLLTLVEAVARDLVDMDRARAIELLSWPNAQALVAAVESVGEH